MAVQKTKKSTSRRNMRRSHDALNKTNVAENATTGEFHRPHHVSPDGYYKGRKVTDANVNT